MRITFQDCDERTFFEHFTEMDAPGASEGVGRFCQDANGIRLEVRRRMAVRSGAAIGTMQCLAQQLATGMLRELCPGKSAGTATRTGKSSNFSPGADSRAHASRTCLRNQWKKWHVSLNAFACLWDSSETGRSLGAATSDRAAAAIVRKANT